jgi:glycerol-3-phosphate dehydrogenase
VRGLVARDEESGRELALDSKVVVNATGAFTDAVRRLDDSESPAIIRPSQGVHVVLDRAFLPGSSAIMVPHTDDGRVLFAIPWLGRVVVGTTETPLEHVTYEPRPLPEEIDFLLEHAARYLTKDPSRKDVLAAFAGIRPLVGVSPEGSTAAISRHHTIHISRSGLLTIAGGKWTTYRKMAEDVVDQAALVAGLDECESKTATLPIREPEGDPDEVVRAAKYEMARTVEDVLARRTRALILDARASIETAPSVASKLANALGRNETWQREQVEAYTRIANTYLP